VLRAALQGRDDPRAAREALAGSREAAELAAALVGIATGAPAGAAARLDEALRRIAARASLRGRDAIGYDDGV
jgi:hypothetical protein